MSWDSWGGHCRGSKFSIAFCIAEANRGWPGQTICCMVRDAVVVIVVVIVVEGICFGKERGREEPEGGGKS